MPVVTLNYVKKIDRAEMLILILCGIYRHFCFNDPKSNRMRSQEANDILTLCLSMMVYFGVFESSERVILSGDR